MPCGISDVYLAIMFHACRFDDWRVTQRRAHRASRGASLSFASHAIASTSGRGAQLRPVRWPGARHATRSPHNERILRSLLSLSFRALLSPGRGATRAPDDDERPPRSPPPCLYISSNSAGSREKCRPRDFGTCHRSWLERLQSPPSVLANTED